MKLSFLILLHLHINLSSLHHTVSHVLNTCSFFIETEEEKKLVVRDHFNSPFYKYNASKSLIFQELPKGLDETLL